ncbi:hypothetical protein [Shouchella patagoniensis]|uniref:hypothetical protein n=1 Tax=Shouchella patagoniensis TaxID=228576 RepID=UPI001472E056|nr:hypothetical protein [Shouchella patagoniensis]
MYYFVKRKDGGTNIYKDEKYYGQYMPLYNGVAVKFVNGRDYIVGNEKEVIKVAKAQLD